MKRECSCAGDRRNGLCERHGSLRLMVKPLVAHRRYPAETPEEIEARLYREEMRRVRG